MNQLKKIVLTSAVNKHEGYDDSHYNNTSFSPSGELRGLEREVSSVPATGACTSSSRVTAGASELLALLRILGEGLRLSCVYKCQVLYQYPKEIKSVFNLTALE